MEVALPLENMTTAEKLRLMETLWDDLCRKSDALDSPSWHGNVLAERDPRFAEGKEPVHNWDEAKERIRRGAPIRIKVDCF